MTNTETHTEARQALIGSLQTRDPEHVQAETQEHLHSASAFLAAAKALILMAESGPPQTLEMKLSRIVRSLGEIIDAADDKVQGALDMLDCSFS